MLGSISCLFTLLVVLGTEMQNMGPPHFPDMQYVNIYYINTTEIPGELLHINMISSHVTKTCYLRHENDMLVIFRNFQKMFGNNRPFARPGPMVQN